MFVALSIKLSFRFHLTHTKFSKEIFIAVVTVLPRTPSRAAGGKLFENTDLLRDLMTDQIHKDLLTKIIFYALGLGEFYHRLPLINRSYSLRIHWI